MIWQGPDLRNLDIPNDPVSTEVANVVMNMGSQPSIGAQEDPSTIPKITMRIYVWGTDSRKGSEIFQTGLYKGPH